jgi:segregation and condensation protein B
VTRNKKSNKNGKSGKSDPKYLAPALQIDRPTLDDLKVAETFTPVDVPVESVLVDIEDLPAVEAAEITAVMANDDVMKAAEGDAEITAVTAGDAEITAVTAGGPSLENAPAQEAEGEIEEARDLSDAHLRGLLEALVFASDKPMKSNELARLASAPLRQVKDALAELKAEFSPRGIVLDEVAGGWLFRTNAQFAPFVRELAGGRPVRLSRAQIETLAIAAYRQPITRPEIDEIRGVDSGATLKLLLERDLVRILGKKDEPGRPLLYGTTTHFLEFFNMKSLKDLPTLREFTELSDESRRVAEAELADFLPESAGTTGPGPARENDAPHDDGTVGEHEVAQDHAAIHDDQALGDDVGSGDVGPGQGAAFDDDEDGERDTIGPPGPVDD